MNALTRFLGGSPLGVAIRLVVFSLLVGWFLSWMDWTPREVWYWMQDLALHAWDSLGSFGGYIMVGAVIVVPVFLIMRLLSYRGRGA